MAIFDQYQAVDDTVQLSAGQAIKFEIMAQCTPLATPSTDNVSAALGGAAPSMSIQSVTSGSYKLGPVISDAFLPGYVNMIVKATIAEVISVGNLKAQILNGFAVINSQRNLPCTDWTIRDDEMDVLTAQGTGSPDVFSPTKSPNLTLGLLALIGIIAILIWRDVREVTAPI